MSEYDSTKSSIWWDGLIELQPQQLVQVAIVGVVIGAVEWLLTLLVRQVIMVPMFCSGTDRLGCGGATDSAAFFALLLGGIVGLMGLVRISVFRPLVIVLASAITLWGISGWLTGAPWYQVLGWFIVLNGLTYATYAWLVRPRAFAPALALVIVVVVLARLVAL